MLSKDVKIKHEVRKSLNGFFSTVAGADWCHGPSGPRIAPVQVPADNRLPIDHIRGEPCSQSWDYESQGHSKYPPEVLVPFQV